MVEICTSSTNGDGQTERPESGTTRIPEDPQPGIERVEAGGDRASPEVGGDSDARRQQLEAKRAYWREWYAKGGKQKIAAARKRKKDGQVPTN